MRWSVANGQRLALERHLPAGAPRGLDRGPHRAYGGVRMRLRALWIQSALAALVGVGVVVQVYLIAAYAFHAGSGALDAHKALGMVIFAIEVLVFLVGIITWARAPRTLILSLALPVVGAIQLALAKGSKWVGALHGAGALAVLGLSGVIHVVAMREARSMTSAAE
jgi:hypothetical protein